LSTQDRPTGDELLLVHAVLRVDENVNLQLINIYPLPCTIVVHDARLFPGKLEELLLKCQGTSSYIFRIGGLIEAHFCTTSFLSSYQGPYNRLLSFCKSCLAIRSSQLCIIGGRKFSKQ
jgi:hypothetical protein